MKKDKKHQLLVQAHAYFDNELSPTERAAFELHLKECRVCQRELVELRQIAGSLSLLNDLQWDKPLKVNLAPPERDHVPRRAFLAGAVLPLLLAVLGLVFGWSLIQTVVLSWQAAYQPGLAEILPEAINFRDQFQLLEFSSTQTFSQNLGVISIPVLGILALVSFLAWWGSMRRFLIKNPPGRDE